MKPARIFLLTLVFATNGFIGSAQTLQTLCSFNGSNGEFPNALTMGSDGNFYGTTAGNLNNVFGTVFMVTTSGALNTLVVFNDSNGAYPRAALSLGNDDNFYGTTSYGGYGHNDGTLFMMTTNGTLTNLVVFNINNGGYPHAGLTLGKDGNFYGTTYGGGSSQAWGTVFKVITNGTLTTLFSFPNTYGSYGAYPNALTLGNDGNFYGTTSYGGITTPTYFNGMGTIFQIAPNGALTTLVSFANTNGVYPQAALTLGNDGNFYGTTFEGGSSILGTVFMVTTNGTLTRMVSFTDSNGAYPNGLTLGSDGNFYGTTEEGGKNGYGTVFKVTTNGTLTTLYSFTGGLDGRNPTAALTLGNDGNFYGTTSAEQFDGSGGYGTVFRLLLPPKIITQPQSHTNNAGSIVTFTVGATSLNPVGYQWQKNFTNLVNYENISGATTNALTIAGISDSDAANYSVIVSNANFSVTSSNATLTVIDPPALVVQIAGGYPQLNLAGKLSNNFVVQYSTNLSGTNWINLRSVTNLLTSPYLFLDPAGVVPPARFYRAFMQ